MAGEAKIQGLAPLLKRLERLPKKLQRNVLRGASLAGAGVLRDEVRARAPRKTGNLRRAIKAKRQKPEGDEVRATVEVDSGRGKRNDAFYWRFLEDGTVHQAPQPFVRPAVQAKFDEATKVVGDYIAKRIEKEAQDA